MLKAAVRGLCRGEEGFEALQRRLKDGVVFLNVYCRSVAEEHEPRGPEGPYRFTDRSVPVYVIKRWDGKTFHQALGFSSDQRAGNRALARALESALKENGPVTPPKAMRPLVKALEKGDRSLEKKQEAWAWREFAKVVKLGEDEKRFPGGPPSLVAEARAGEDEKRFPGGPPSLVAEARARMATIEKAAREALAAARELSETDPKRARADLVRLQRRYGRIPTVGPGIKEALDSLRDS